MSIVKNNISESNFSSQILKNYYFIIDPNSRTYYITVEFKIYNLNYRS